MRFFEKAKDGGAHSNVDAYFLIEIKSLFSIALLKFNKGTRENFHNHAFNAWTWFIKGDLVEETPISRPKNYRRSLLPKVTKKENMHRVIALKDSWAITLRGPWSRTWKELTPQGKTITLTHGRKVIK